MDVDGYLAHFESTWTAETPVEQVRFVVLDSETTGLDTKRDRIITIGAVTVVVQDGVVVQVERTEKLRLARR